MLKLVKTDLKVLFSRIEFKIALFFTILLVCGHLIYMCTTRTYGKDINDVFKASDFFITNRSVYGMLLYMFLFPLIAAFSYSDIFLVEKASGLHMFYITRTGRTKYFVSKIITVAVSGVVVILIPLLISFLLSFIAAPVYNNYISYTNVPSDYYQPITDGVLFPGLYVSSPYLYNIVFIIIPCIFGALFALLSFAISTVKSANKIFVLILPTTIFLIISVICTALGQLRYTPSFYLHKNIRGLSLNGLFINLLVLSVLTAIILSFKLKEKDIL